MTATHYCREHSGKNFESNCIVGKSAQLCKCFHLAGQVARTNTTVLISGESGTGKELISKAIHNNSDRALGPFLPVNCASIPHTLLEAELFGYEEGAFTGARRRKKGNFEFAAGGTLFLDEIGDLDFDIQAKLLRVLEDRRFQRLGGTGFIDADVRIITATNKDLKQMIEQGRFRDDLYYRLSVFPIHMPPLRERGDDVILLAEEFILQFSKDFGKKPPYLAESAKKHLRDYHWRGNIRELKNTIERAMILCKRKKISADHLNLNVSPEKNCSPQSEIEKFIVFLLKDHNFSLVNLEARILYHAIQATNYNISKASKLLGLSRPTLRYRLEKHQNLIDDFQNLDRSVAFQA